MAQKKETVFRQRFDKKLARIPNSFFESIQQKTIQGTPDKLGVIRGIFIALEFKASIKEKPTPLQTLKLDRIKKAGGYGFVVFPENEDQILNILEKLSTGEICSH